MYRFAHFNSVIVHNQYTYNVVFTSLHLMHSRQNM